MKKFIFILLITINLITSSIVYAEGAGLQVNYNNVEVSITYNDNVNDKITGVEYIREPSGALFDVIHLLQKNYKTTLTSNKNLKVNIDNHGGSLWVYQKEKPSTVVLDISNLKNLDNKIMLTAICKGLNLKGCSVTNNATVDLYLSDSYVSSTDTDLVDFGCFPCRNNKTITITDRYTPAKPNKYPPKFKKVTVNRQTIYHYFNKLRE